MLAIMITSNNGVGGDTRSQHIRCTLKMLLKMQLKRNAGLLQDPSKKLSRKHSKSTRATRSVWKETRIALSKIIDARSSRSVR